MKSTLVIIVTIFSLNVLFSQSLVIKKKNGLYGVKDKITKKEIVPYQFDEIQEIGMKEPFFILSKNGKYGIVNSKNEPIVPIECDSILPTIKTFPLNYYIYKGDEIGYINHHGHYLPVEYEKIQEVPKLKLILSKNGKYGVVYTNGTVIYDLKYDFVVSFTDDYLCAVLDNEWVGLRDNKIIHRGKDVLFHKPDEMASCISCSKIEDPDDRFKCTQKYLNQIVLDNVQYPKKAQEDNKEGMLLFAYTVDEEGQIIEIKTIRDGDGYFEEECKRVIHLFPKFIPAKYENRAVKCVMPQLFSFKLN